MKRLLFLLVLALGLMLAACEGPDSSGKRPLKERGPEKAAKVEQPRSESGAKKEIKRPKHESQPSSSPAGAQYSSPSAAAAQYSTTDADYSSGPSPEDVLASQYRHINAGQYGAAYDLFDEQSHQLISQEQYEAYFASNAPYEITSYSFSSVQPQGDTASVVADLTVSSASGEEAYQLTQQLVREDGSWRVVMRDEQVTSFAEAGSPSASASASASSASASASAASEQASGDHDATVTVSRVVDGDTIEISRMISGTDEVRLIGVDTPETKHPEEGVEPYGPEASTFATDELTGQRIELEFGAERLDQYDRLLAYVYVGEEMFNEVLLEEGYAQDYPYPPNTKYAGRFEEAQEVARAGGLGIWGLSLQEQCQLANHGNGIGEGSPGCDGVAEESPTATSTATATATPNATATATAATGRGLPPAPGGDYDCADLTYPQAQQVLSSDPSDPHQLDGDDDGEACEP